ncbi:MAG: phosphatidylserine decarboxylase [Comamonadaceae bacterium]|nr:MAG: phosphatidylserine decarboxylase [Comamonadaceae bacterium]
MSDRLSVLPQYLLPKQALTNFAGFVASRERGWVTTEIIRRFVAKYAVNMDEALDSDISNYRTFNDFFTRALKPGARPLADADLISPVDGAISQFGPIDRNQIFQAKGHSYTTTALVGGDAALAAQYDNGSFATLYLSPKDYHRIHMPCDGRLVRMVYVPGELFSVNPLTARGVPGLFARNERVVCVFESPRGPFVLVLVGATIVGSMATVWHGVVNPPRGKDVRSWDYPSGRPGEPAPAIHLKKGDEMGRFLLGSTVVMLFPKEAGQSLRFNPDWTPGRSIRLGEPMASYANDRPDVNHAAQG